MIRSQSIDRIGDEAIFAFSRNSTRIWQLADQAQIPVVVWNAEKRQVEHLKPEDPITRNPDFIRLECEHRYWLKQFDQSAIDAWERQLRSHLEGAMTESLVRRLLQSNGVMVAPNFDKNSKGRSPDFLCTKHDKPFYVEVTCISRETAARRIGVDDRDEGASSFANLTDVISGECSGKVTQCADFTVPTVLAIGTFHGFAGAVCFSKHHAAEVLSGKLMISFDFDPHEARAVGKGQTTTELQYAAFERRDRQRGVAAIRQSISALLLVSFSGDDARGLGIHNPDAMRPFDASILPGLEFGTRIEDGKNMFHVEWSNGETGA